MFRTIDAYSTDQDIDSGLKHQSAAAVVIAAPVAPAMRQDTHSMDGRDRLVAAPGSFKGQPYWLALAQCGGTYFRLHILYTDRAVRARVVKPDPKANAEFTKKFKEAIKIATAFFDGAERFLVTDRSLGRDDAVPIYNAQTSAIGEQLKTIDAALARAEACPELYQACRLAHPKECSEPPASSR